MVDIRNKNEGSIEVICGCMFAGKTEELIRRVKRINYAKRSCVVFKPSIDKRYHETDVVSHSKYSCKAYPINTVEDCMKVLDFNNLPYAVCFDEVQFLPVEFLKFIDMLASKGVRVICAGLDQDFKGETFGLMGDLLALAEDVTKLSAICMKCGGIATRTQRLINGVPASINDKLVLVGEKESYEARCRFCHEVRTN